MKPEENLPASRKGTETHQLKRAGYPLHHKQSPVISVWGAFVPCDPLSGVHQPGGSRLES
eukprot:1161373-Pelagomonas_calceolata.AAC.1